MTEHTEATVHFPATVVYVIDDLRVVINRGADHGIKVNQRFFVYYLDTEPIEDPETGDQLGLLEISRGMGIATHVQEQMTTVSSASKGPSGLLTFGLYGDIKPFNHARVGDKAKPI